MATNIIYLDKIYGPEITLEDVFRAESEKTFQLNGKPLGIVKFMERLGEEIEKNWSEVGDRYLKNNLSPTQYIYFNKKPKIYPFFADINHLHEENGTSTQDSPFNKSAPIIIFDVANEGPASLTRKAWGGRRELTPRLRFMISYRGLIYPVLAHRKEYIINFVCYGNNSKEAYITKEILEFFFHTKREILFGLGGQQFYVESNMSKSKTDSNKTKLVYRELNLYLRMEEWYIGEGLPEISGVEIEWVSANPGEIPPQNLSFGELTIDNNNP